MYEHSGRDFDIRVGLSRSDKIFFTVIFAGFHDDLLYFLFFLLFILLILSIAVIICSIAFLNSLITIILILFIYFHFGSLFLKIIIAWHEIIELFQILQS